MDIADDQTSFQLSLLSGSNTLKETDLYIICAIFIAGTLAWYTLFRMKPSVWVLSAPWVVFGCAFTLIGFPSLYGPFTAPRVILQRVSVWLYAAASSAGFLFFGLNFGDEAGAATEIWVTRACIVQGLQQIWGKSLADTCMSHTFTDKQSPLYGTGVTRSTAKIPMLSLFLEPSSLSLGHWLPSRSPLRH
jgi:glycogen synthase